MEIKVFFEGLVGFLLLMVALHLAARIISAACFRSKAEYEIRMQVFRDQLEERKRTAEKTS